MIDLSGRIKGITVEIGGDTTGLQKALKQVESSIRKTQTALRDVNRLLKLDPSNTTLLAQKQKLLKDSIQATKEKLDSLKEAQKQAKEQLENGTLGQDKYDALQREIIATEQELRRLQEEAATTNAKLEKIDAIGGKMKDVGDSIAGAGQKMMGVTTVIGGVGAAAVKVASDFDSAMSKVSAVSGATGKDFDALRDKAREMGSKTKFSATEAAEAMNYMAMAGWKTEDMLAGIEGVMNLAAASGEDLATTSDIVTDALTAFGLSASDSAHFADILAAASSNANTNVSMMGETFKYCAPIAGALGFSAEDTAEAIGLMANAGIKSTQAGTALRTIMNNLSKDFKISGKNIGEVTIATTNADGSMRNLRDILGDCRTAFSGLTESEKAQAAQSLVGKNAMSGFLALMNAGEKDIKKLENAIDSCDGTAEEMATTMQDNLAGQLTILKSQIQELAISFADVLMPSVRKIVSAFQGFVDRLNGMSDGTRALIIKVALLVASIGPLLIIVGNLISVTGSAMQGFVKLSKKFLLLQTQFQNGYGLAGKLATAIGGISGPVVAVAAVVAVLVAAFIHLWRTNEEFRNKIKEIWSGIHDAISGVIDAILNLFSAFGLKFSSLGEALSFIWNKFCSLLAPVFEGAFSTVAFILETVLNALSALINIFAAIITGDWGSAWEKIKEIVSAALSVVHAVIVTVLNSIKAFFSTTWNAIYAALSPVLNAIQTVVTSVWNNIKAVTSTVWNGVKSVISTVGNAIKTTVSSAVNSVKSTVTSVWNNIKSVTSSVWNGIKQAIINPVNAARDAVRNVVNQIKGFFANMKLSLPHIKLPHFKVSGKLSIDPPSVPKLSISWYKEGGIMVNPTIFGFNGSSLLGGGEAGAEAILPLKGFYDKLDAMLSSKLNTAVMEQYLSVIAKNSMKNIYLDDGTLVGKLLPAIDTGLSDYQIRNERGNR